MAFDGTTLYFINGFGTDTLYELDPATGVVLDSTPITAGSGNYDGLAVLNGLVYILDFANSDILVFDPVTDTITNILDIDGTNPGVTLVGGIAGITGPDRIVATQAAGLMVHEIDPTTGAVTASFAPTTASAGSYIGAAVVDGDIYLGAATSSTIDVFSRSGIFQRSVATPFGISALGGDDIPSTVTSLVGDFDIQVNFLGEWTASQREAVLAAAQRWERIVIADLPDVNVPGIGLVDDLVINAGFAPLDGAGNVLAGSAPTYVRSESRLPAAGDLLFDAEDLALLEANGKFETTALHEIGHLLGIGTIWQDLGLVTGSGSADPQFVGPHAVAAYNALTGGSYSGVPIENTGGGGNAEHHWRESIFTTELMTGYAEASGVAEPISAVTIASLADLGYVVDMDRAEVFAPIASPQALAQQGASGSGVSPGNALQPVQKIGKRIVLDQAPQTVDSLDASKSVDGQPVVDTETTAGPGQGKLEREPNDSIATAQNLDNENWSLESDPNIGDTLTNTSTTIPHITVSGTGDGTFDYFSFTVSNAGDRGIFDIDFGADLLGGAGSIDTELFLFDAAGNLLAQNDDASTAAGAGGSVSGLDAYIEYTFASPGLYVIGVGEFPSTGTNGGITGNTPDLGDTYTLQISVENHPLGGTPSPGPSPPAAAVADTLLGGDGNDLLMAYNGDDLLDGGLGDDTLDGGDGNDSAFGNAGRDSILGGAGDDQLSGQGGGDTVDGGAGN
ncbi:MAG: hypothetical protein GXP27_00970, partial [Planctomycetes bacterium]|nr:hypothetical protein [Planctomycetota bacterium]